MSASEMDCLLRLVQAPSDQQGIESIGFLHQYHFFIFLNLNFRLPSHISVLCRFLIIITSGDCDRLRQWGRKGVIPYIGI